MNFVCFYHSLASDWNHGNAHFLRGVASELRARGHGVVVHEQEDNWSRQNLEHDHGPAAAEGYLQAYPLLAGVERRYRLGPLPSGRPPQDPAPEDAAAVARQMGLEEILAEADVVLVHEWTPPAVVAAIAAHRRAGGRYRLLFHDTHHRMVSAPQEMARFDLRGFDGILAYGRILAEAWAARGWDGRVWTWHEAADTRLFRPMEAEKEGDLIWIGNWGDEERTAELHEFLVEPVRRLGLNACVHGVRYPPQATAALAAAGIRYGGWIANHRVPAAFARYRLTVHVPRRYYVTHLPGIPTIRPFEAMACGIPLICSPWEDVEGLFSPGEDYLVARDGAEMQRHMRFLLNEPDAASAMAERGRRTILARHTCAHRVDELLAILAEQGVGRNRKDAKAQRPDAKKKEGAMK